MTGSDVPWQTELWDWRRAVADLYAAIRREPDPVGAHALWQATRAHLFAHNPQSPIEPGGRAPDGGPHIYPYDPALRLMPQIVPLTSTIPLILDAGADGHVAAQPFGRTEGLAADLGGELTLYWIGGYGGGVFLPFRDATSGSETYGGGRYLLDTIKGADLGQQDGRAILDFNFSYFPSCAYASRYVCPLAPPDNRLPAAIRAGECHAAPSALLPTER